jgi:Tol biopolymer transport system component
VSSDGRFVAFYSTATNLVAQGSSGNIFVRDTCAGALNCSPQTAAVDLAPDGGAPNAAAESQVAISGDGRFVAFASSATNLVTPGLAPAPAQSNVYVRDLCTGVDAPAGCVPHTELVSSGANGDFAVGASSSPSLSSDGRFVAFVSAAANLVADLAVSGNGVYVRDTCAGVASTAACVPQTYLASSSINNGSPAQVLGTPVISADGRYVAFDASNSLAAVGTDQPVSQVFLADTCLGPNSPVSCVPSTSEISVSADGSSLQGVNKAPSMSDGARFVVFESTGPDAVPNVFLRDTCLAVATGCAPSTVLLEQNAAAPSLSPDGRYVSFVAGPSSTPGTAGGVGSLYVYDTCFGAVAACSPQAYPIGAAGIGAASLPLTANASPAPLASGGSSLAIGTSASIPGLPMSGHGDVLLMATPF